LAWRRLRGWPRHHNLFPAIFCKSRSGSSNAQGGATEIQAM